MTNSAILLVLTIMGAAGPAGTGDETQARRVCIQAIEAKPGDNRTDDEIDPKLAEKLRITVETLGVVKPDLTSLGKTEKELVAGASVSLAVQRHSVEVTCKSVDEKETALEIELFEERVNPDTKAKEKRSLNRHSVKLKEDEVWPVNPAQSGKSKKIFVISTAK